MSWQCPGSIASACWRWRRWRVPRATKIRSMPPFEQPPRQQVATHPNGWCVSFHSIRRPRPRRRSSVDRDGNEIHIAKGAFEVIAKLAEVPADARRQVDDLAAQGHRVHRGCRGPAAMRCAWPASSRSAIRRARILRELIAELRDHGRPHRHGDRGFGRHGGGDRRQGRHRRSGLPGGALFRRGEPRTNSMCSRASCRSRSTGW